MENIDTFYNSLSKMRLTKLDTLSRKLAGSSLTHPLFITKNLEINKKEWVIFEVNIKKVNLNELGVFKEGEIKLPLDNLFIEIPDWTMNVEGKQWINCGGISIRTINHDDKKIIMCNSLWKIEGTTFLKPISLIFNGGIFYNKLELSKDIPILRFGKSFLTSLDNRTGETREWMIDRQTGEEITMSDTIKTETTNKLREILLWLLFKIQKKEYTSYKKWKPSGYETKEIVYSSLVSGHKRHFWEDTGRFKRITSMSREQLLFEGYELDEVVFRDGELRRDVPYTNIGSFVTHSEQENNPDNRRISLNGRTFKREEQLGRILIELFPDCFIKRHDRKTLKRLELDYNIRELKLAFEYDGEQHYDKTLCEEVFHSNFEELQERDRKKDVQCRELGITLIRIKYDEVLTLSHIRNKIKQAQKV